MTADRYRILLVEDNPGDAMLLVEAMRELAAPVEVLVVPNAILAWSALTSQGPYAGTPVPHMAVLDINLPLIDGLSALATIQASPTMRTIPVWMLTSSSRAEDRERALALGAVGFTVKPAVFERYLGVAQELLAALERLHPPQSDDGSDQDAEA